MALPEKERERERERQREKLNVREKEISKYRDRVPFATKLEGGGVKTKKNNFFAAPLTLYLI